jgi:molybdate transport system substrate-binding protein
MRLEQLMAAMKSGVRIGMLLAVLPGMFVPRAAAANEVRVAAAADLKFAMQELATEFEKSTGTKVGVTFGSSGNFFSQLQNGAPFDIFMSADIEYPKKLEAAKLTEPGSLYLYALGRMVIWLPAESKLDLASLGWKSLLDSSIQKIAIGNPQHAPYGWAAFEALQIAGIYEQVKSKLVYGEDISQAAQFVQSGNAQAGILALSLAVSPPLRGGKSWEIPTQQHSPLLQGAVVLRAAKNKTAAMSFLTFLKSDAAKTILQKWGFGIPSSTPAPGIPK